MATAALDSVGYDGVVDEVAWARLTPYMGATYAVGGPGDLAVSVVAGLTRTVQVAAGEAFGHGVLDEFPVATQQLDNVGSGTRWDLITVRRDWQPPAGTSVIDKINGSSTEALPAGRVNDPGVQDDQPLALVQCSSTSTLPTALIDLRVWRGPGGLRAAHPLALKFLTHLGAVVHIGDDVYRCERDVTGNLVWSRLPIRSFPMFDAANAIGNGGEVLAGFGRGSDYFNDFKVQASTWVDTTGAGGVGVVTFPTPFPNGLLVVLPTNGDDDAANDTTVNAIATRSSRTGFAFRAWGPSGGVRIPLANKRMRVNWLAIGY